MEPKRTLSQKNTFMLIEKQKPLSSQNVYISERRGGQPNIFWYISILSFEITCRVLPSSWGNCHKLLASYSYIQTKIILTESGKKRKSELPTRISWPYAHHEFS